MVGRIPDGPHRLAEARAHLAREIAVHQAKLDRYAALVAGGNGVCVGVRVLADSLLLLNRRLTSLT